MNKYLCVVVILAAFVFSCKAQSTQCKGCNEEVVIKEQWLTELLEGKDKAAVFSFHHEDSTYLEFHHCYQCPDAIVTFYTCDGTRICYQGGFAGANNCPDFELKDRKQIYPK